MSDKVWVIRGRFFAYNDEWYNIYTSDYGATKGTFENQELAVAEYKKLEIAATRSMAIELGNIDIFCEGGNTEQLASLNTFIFERTGKYLLDEGYLANEDLVYQLNDDDLFDFINLAGINHYQLVEFAKDTTFFVLWLVEQQKYHLTSGDIEGEYIYQATSSDDLLSGDANLVYSFDNQEIIIEGALTEITAYPALLEKILQDNNSARYDVDNGRLVIEDDEVLIELNPLLKKPIFEIRQLTIEQIAEIEATLS